MRIKRWEENYCHKVSSRLTSVRKNPRLRIFAFPFVIENETLNFLCMLFFHSWFIIWLNIQMEYDVSPYGTLCRGSFYCHVRLACVTTRIWNFSSIFIVVKCSLYQFLYLNLKMFSYFYLFFSWLIYHLCLRLNLEQHLLNPLTVSRKICRIR